MGQYARTLIYVLVCTHKIVDKPRAIEAVSSA